MLTFVAIGATREEIQTGLAMIVWPVLIGMFSMYLFGSKLLIAQRFLSPNGLASRALLPVLVVVAGSLALAVPQFLE
jgi:formate hydrogenlyase subunit 3/multisubunit Na+/H+ antiporter MnhD subunit